MQVGVTDSNHLKIQCEPDRRSEIQDALDQCRKKRGGMEWYAPIHQFHNLKSVIDDGDTVTDQASELYDYWYGRTADTLNTDLLDDDIELYEWQGPMARDMISRTGFVSCADMGTGKTPSSIAAALDRVRNRKADSILVFCPAMLRTQWAGEIDKFTDERIPDPVLLKGQQVQRYDRDTGEVYDADASIAELASPERDDALFFIASYYTLSMDAASDLKQKHWGVIIYDEISKLKNPEASRSKTAHQLSGNYQWGLTGTPIEKSTKDWWSIVQTVEPYYLGEYEEFKRRYLEVDRIPVSKYKTVEVVDGNQNIDELREKVDPIIHRVRKEDVWDDMPPLTVQDRTIELGDDQRHAHTVLQDELRQSMQDGSGFDGEIQFMQGVCNSTNLLRQLKNFDAKDYSDRVGSMDEEAPKLDEIATLIERADMQGRKTLTFTKHKRFLDEIRDHLDDELDDIFDHCAFMHGDTPEQRRNEILNRTQNDDIDHLIITDILSYGANLQHLDVIINADLPYNPATLNQRIDRIRRLGREDPVLCINIYAEDTIESTIRRKLEKRQALFNDFFDEDQQRVDIDKNEIAQELLQ